ncbi:cytochrome P450 [Ilyonectria robusta]|uniref:cytochrome P450 n=1 Tax=Ilyonectria robusta TaxID=1079257 RepID=UPI001E8E3B96|nr:cytochrome P450 [Ilyonectria robusta]KAH8654917.1 cytochrome P450 [Ilyonectria robusta]
MRPFVYRFLPERAAITRQWVRGRRRVQACMQERTMKGGILENPPSMLDHLSSGKNSHMADDLEKQVLFQMTLVAVGTVTTFASTVQAVYDLVMHPEYIPILRDEIELVPVDENGMFTKEAITAMQKLDSFIKESQRLAAADLSKFRCISQGTRIRTDTTKGTFQRAATANMTLPDGTFVPKGTKIEANTYSIHHDEVYYKNASTFDGLRFYRQRQNPGHENKHLYVSVGRGDLSFGYGRHACPGRYLGHLNIKLVMAELLRKYDLKAAGTQTPKSQAFEAIVSPDADFKILMRNREL